LLYPHVSSVFSNFNTKENGNCEAFRLSRFLERCFLGPGQFPVFFFFCLVALTWRRANRGFCATVKVGRNRGGPTIRSQHRVSWPYTFGPLTAVSRQTQGVGLFRWINRTPPKICFFLTRKRAPHPRNPVYDQDHKVVYDPRVDFTLTKAILPTPRIPRWWVAPPPLRNRMIGILDDPLSQAPGIGLYK